MVEGRTTMKAVQLIDGYGEENLKVVEVPIPKPRSGQVLIKVDSSPINPSDIAFVKGVYGVRKPLPTIPGFEGSGKVVATGGGFMSWGLMGKNVAFVTNNKLDGAWAEYVVTDAMTCVKTGDNDVEAASCSFVNPLTVLAFLDVIKTGGHKAVIHTAAASSLGKMLVRMMQDQGIPLINVVRRQEQVDMLKELGAEHVLNQTDEDFCKQLAALSKELDATICFDAVCGDLLGQIFNNMPKNGIIYVYGQLSMKGGAGISGGDLISKNKKIHGFWLTVYLKNKGIWSKMGLISTVQKLLGSTLSTTIANRFDLGHVPEAFYYYKKHMSAGKVLIKPWMLPEAESENKEENKEE